MKKHFFQLNGHSQEVQSDTKPIHEHNANPLSSSESMKDKTDSHLDEESSATDKCPDDLEVDNILSHSKVEQPSAEHRANLIVSEYSTVLPVNSINKTKLIQR